MRLFVITNLLLLLFMCKANGQNNGKAYADSVLSALPDVVADTSRVDIYTILASEYNDIDLDSALYYGNLALDLAEQREMTTRLYDAQVCVGLTYFLLSDAGKAEAYFTKALKGFKKLKDTIGIADAYTWLAEIQQEKHNISKALELQFQALSLFEKIGAEENIARCYASIGMLYRNVDEPVKAMDYYRKAYSLYSKSGNRVESGSVLLSIAEHHLESGKHDSALIYAKESYSIYDSVGNEFFMAYCADIIGEVYLETHEYGEALKALRQSADVYRSVNDRYAYASSIATLGRVYLEAAEDNSKQGVSLDGTLMTKTQLYKLAIEHFETSRKIYVEELGMVSLAYLYQKMAMAYEGVGQIDKSLIFYKQYMTLKDSFDAENQGKKVAELDAKRAMTLKDKELELHKLTIAKKRNERGFLLGGIVLLIGVSGIIFYNYRQRGITNKLLAEEKHKSEELLLNILPEEVAEELKEKGTADATHFDEVTVLFTDFVNFSKASERMTSQELVDELHTCFKAFDEITSRYNIEKIKTIGDAYLAVCGLPVPDKEHAENVVKAAKDIIQFISNRREALGEKAFEIRIGVHSGDVVAGIVGVKKFAYDIWGDTVNTAARMEQNSQPGKINISQSTYERVRDMFACSYRGELEAKGKGMLKMYFVDM